MKRFIQYSLWCIIIIAALTSCKKSFQDLTQNNNVPTSVPASLLLNGVLNNLVDLPNSSKEIYCQYYIYNYDYYGNNRYDFGAGDNYYTTLKNVMAMEDQAIKGGAPVLNPYSALGKFFRAYFFSKMSLEMGDIPMTQALQGIKNLTPVYDNQKVVMIQCLKWLGDANTDLTTLIGSGGNSLSGDIFYNGDLTKWQKVVNTFKIRLLIQLSKKSSDVEINVPAQFASIIGDPAKYPIMQSSADNLQYTFIQNTNNYPQTPDNFGQNGSRQNSSATYISLLTSFQDPRLFVTAEPARDLVDNKKQSPTDFNSFVGADPGLDLGIMYNNAGLQKYSFINRKRYYSTYTGEPAIQIGYSELMFNIAEGINRGWAVGNAETFYQAGIQASFQYYGIPATTGSFTAYFYRPGSSSVSNLANYDTYPINVNFANYYAQPLVQYTPGSTGLNQILNQKYIALFRQSGLESYFTYRRTGVPNFSTGPGSGNGSRIAKRFQYPSSEKTANAKNYIDAITTQFGGNDDINGIMWILK